MYEFVCMNLYYILQLTSGKYSAQVCGQLIRWRTVAEINSLTMTTPNTASIITVTSCHKNWLIEE